MTKIPILSSIVLTTAFFGTLTVSNAVVPGSDTFKRARDTVANQSVVASSPSEAHVSREGSQSSYGFPITTSGVSTRSLVPGSSTFDDAAAGDALMSVITGSPQGSVPVFTSGGGSIVPGSDSF